LKNMIKSRLACFPDMSPPNSEQGMVLVMGITGSGKSYFVNQLNPGAASEGSTLNSCSSICQA
jgi:predicted GTPase